jgi:hypothetical protein
MSDTSEQSSSIATAATEPPAKANATGPRPYWPNRLVRFGREHPALTIVGVAGVGLAGGLEMAAGVVLGAGVAALIGRSDGRGMAEPAPEIRGRMRQLLDRTPHDLRQRARAVMLAARGKITPPPEAEHKPPPPKPEAGATESPPT